MNRKNLTAAVLAGLAGVAGAAGGLQAANHTVSVSLNPDGLGEVLIYPYYTTNDDNTTLITVVNTTGSAKAAKVRFLEGFNSREVLDFNLYLSEYDVWVGAVADSEAFGADPGVPHLFTPDTSCTVPYIYEDGYVESLGGGLQAFLDYAYTGDDADGGPTDISRASEGYLEIIEMGDMLGEDGVAKDELLAFAPHAARKDSEWAATHVIKEDDDGNEYVEPNDCGMLVANWTYYSSASLKDHPLDGFWLEFASSDGQFDGVFNLDCDDTEDSYKDLCVDDDRDLESTGMLAGGLFGGAAIINVPKGTMHSYDAKAVTGFDTTANGLHFEPGTINPSLNDGNTEDANVLLAGGMTTNLIYDSGVEAVSAVFMHDTIANTFVIDEEIAAATEWIITMPTKAWYVDTALTDAKDTYYIPDASDPDCLDWEPTDPNPFRIAPNGTYGDGGEDCPVPGDGAFKDWEPGCDFPVDYPNCTPIKVIDEFALAPFTEAFDGESCDEVQYFQRDREESPSVTPGVIVPPVVSPAPPPGDTPETPIFELCYEVNVLRFGEESVFGTESDLLYSVTNTPDEGWARITFFGKDEVGLVGLPVIGFSAEQYTNGFLEGGVLANYGGLFNHKGSVNCPVMDGENDCVSND
jgi:hypothetical protein